MEVRGMSRNVREAQRGHKRRKTNPLVIIVCDAKETEPVYFNNFKDKNKPLKVEIATGAAGKGYSAIVKEAKRAFDKHTKGYAGKWSFGVCQM